MYISILNYFCYTVTTMFSFFKAEIPF